MLSLSVRPSEDGPVPICPTVRIRRVRLTPIPAILSAKTGKSSSIDRRGLTCLPIDKPSGFAPSSDALAARNPAAPEQAAACLRKPRLEVDGISTSPFGVRPAGFREPAERGYDAVALGGCGRIHSGEWIAESGLRRAESGLRRADCGERIADCGERIAESGWRSADCGLRIADSGVRSAEGGERIAECGLRRADCGERIAESGERIAERGL